MPVENNISCSFESFNKFSFLKKITLPRALIVLIFFCLVAVAGLFAYHIKDISEQNARASHETRQRIALLSQGVDKVLSYCASRAVDDTYLVKDIDPVPYQIPHSFSCEEKQGKNYPNTFLIQKKSASLYIDTHAFEKYYGVQNVRISRENLGSKDAVSLPSGGYILYTVLEKDPVSSFLRERRGEVVSILCGVVVVYFLCLGVYITAYMAARRSFQGRVKDLLNATEKLETGVCELGHERDFLTNQLTSLRKKGTFQQRVCEFLERKQVSHFEKVKTLSSVLLSSIESDPTTDQVRFLARELLSSAQNMGSLEVRDINPSRVSMKTLLETVFSHLEWDIQQKSVNISWEDVSSQEIYLETDPHILEIYLALRCAKSVRACFKGATLHVHVEQDLEGVVLSLSRQGRGCGDEALVQDMWSGSPLSPTLIESIEYHLNVQVSVNQNVTRIFVKKFQSKQGFSQNVVPLFA